MTLRPDFARSYRRFNSKPSSFLLQWPRIGLATSVLLMWASERVASAVVCSPVNHRESLPMPGWHGASKLTLCTNHSKLINSSLFEFKHRYFMIFSRQCLQSYNYGNFMWISGERDFSRNGLFRFWLSPQKRKSPITHDNQEQETINRLTPTNNQALRFLSINQRVHT